MKTQNLSSLSARRGIALVIVLSVLLLMSALLVAFMGRVSTERASQRAATSTFEAKQAFESAINLVISQIREATKDETGTVGWASQPGVIRTFDDNGRDLKVFKLYSHEALQVDASAYRPNTPAESGFNPGSPTQAIDSSYVNLNEPAFTPVPGQPTRVTPHYPIVDPYARKDYSNSTIGAEPKLPGRGSVQGFYCTNIVHRSQALDQHGNKVLDLPMRVKWLYHLKDGTVSAQSAAGIIAGATKENPPVARVAFWTDDESAKLNLNTAGENTFWDTPAASTIQEAGRIDGNAQLVWNADSLHLAASQPARDEFPRYPGHPATTCLSPALRWLFPTGWTDREFKEALFRILPRIPGGVGTSVAGTENPWALYFHPTTGLRQNNIDPRVAERDRLFATVDEFWFRPDRSPLTDIGFYNVFRDPSPSQQRNLNAPAKADPAIPQLESRFGLTPAGALERMRFFLTVASRSSDLNLSGKPRIPVWPMADQPVPVPPGATDKRSAFDDVIAFCSVVAKKNYYWVRHKSWDPTHDFENAGREKPDAASPSGRNKVIFQYLQQLTAKNVPGTDRSFLSKYQADRDQILVQIFDYIRSTNLVDTGNKAISLTFPPPAGPYPLAYTPGYDNRPESDTAKYSGGPKSNLGSGQVIPTNRKEGGVVVNRGFGRFLTISESGLAFFVDKTEIPGLDVEKPANPTDIPIRAILLTEMFSCSPGYPAHSEAYAYTVEDAPKEPTDNVLEFVHEDPTKPAVKMRLARKDANFVEVDAWRGPQGRFFMPTRGFANQFRWDSNANGDRAWKRIAKPSAGGIMTADNPLASTDYERYPFVSQRFFVPRPSANALPPTFKFRGGRIKYNIHTLNIPDANLPPNYPPFHPSANPNPIQEVFVDFGAGKAPFTVPMPLEIANVGHAQILNPVLGNWGVSAEWTNNIVIRTMEINGKIPRGHPPRHGCLHGAG